MTEPASLHRTGKYLCELIVDGPREYKCYAELVGTAPSSAITDADYVGYFTNRLSQAKDSNGVNLKFTGSNAAALAACVQNTAPTLTNNVYSTTH